MRLLRPIPLILCAMAGSAAVPGPQAILARARQAQGGQAWDMVTALRSVGRLETSGLAGPLDLLEELATGANVTRVDLGAIQQTEGFDGRQAWVQDSSGVATVKGDAEALQNAANGAYMASRAYWYPDRWPAECSTLGLRTEGGRNFQVLGILPRGGRAFELWFDAATGLLDRQVVPDGRATETTRFADYRDFAGLKLPFSVRSGNGKAEFDEVIHYERFVLGGSIPPGAFAVPAPPPPDSGFEGEAQESTFPIEVEEDGHVYFRAKVPGKGAFWFCLDSGAEAAAITPRAVKAMGLHGQGAVQAGGVGAQVETAQAVKVERLLLGAAWMRDQIFWSIPGLEAIGDVQGEPCAGVLGSNLFKRFVVRVDYGKRAVTLIRPEAWHPPAGAVAVPFVFNRSIPQVEGALDGIPGSFTLDTGSGTTLDVCSPFVARHHLVANAGVLYPMTPYGGIGGEGLGFETRARELRIGALTLKSPIVGLSTLKAGAFADPNTIGNLGGRFFRRFVVTFDYPHQVVHFQANAHSDDRDLWSNTSGLRVKVEAGTARITTVLPHSPAQENGLLPGDQILEINGYPVKDLTHGQMAAQIDAAPGTQLALKLQSGDQTRVVSLVLRDLL